MMTLTAYARTIGKSKQYIHKLYQQGKLKESIVTDEGTGKVMIVKKIADLELSGKLPYNINTTDQDNSSENNPPVNSSIEEAKLTKIYYEGLMEKAKYEEYVGTLIEVDEVRNEALRAGLILKERVLSVASQVAPKILGLNSIFDIKNIINKYMTDALREFSQSKFQEEEK